MPINKIRITFVSVAVKDSADIWGDGEWVFKATIDGKAVGNPKQCFEAKDRGTITLPPEWSAEVDVSGKTKFTDRVKVTFSGTDIDVIKDDFLGEVSYEFKYPFSQNKSIYLESPVQKGWLFFPDHQYYTLQVKIEVTEKITPTGGPVPWNTAVNASRQHDGSTTFTTVSGYQIIPRVEVCPVIPTPANPSPMPERPNFADAFGLTPGKVTAQDAVVTLWPIPDLNSTYNPSLIPILPRTDPDFAKKVAKLAVTYYEPGDLDTTKFTWKVKSGPSEIVGGNTGLEIQLVGTGSGDKDELTEVEVRWDGATGTLLATFRAWVGKIKTVHYRINLINGTSAATSVALPPQAYANELLMARVIYWQAGLDLVPDPDTTTWDNATRTDATGAPLPPGVFIVPVTDDTLTVNVNNFAVTPASRLNSRRGVVHAVYVCSTPSTRAAATDIQNVDGKPYKLGGTPSSSWVLPSGVPPDDAAGTLTMNTFPSSQRLKNKAAGDDDYVKARRAIDPNFSYASLAGLYAAVFPSNWSSNPTANPNAGINAAHEIGHCLGLMHRGHTNQGTGAHDPQGSDDGIDCMAIDGIIRGHPWHENVMTYGYGGNTTGVPRAQDIDLLQAAVIRKHPACK